MLFYVYDLIDPRTGEVFYVGKGQGKRYAYHEREAKRGVRTAKCRLIREILASGRRPAVRIVAEFRREATAYELETTRISEFGLQNLTNIAPGGPEEGRKKSDPDTRMARLLLGFALKTDGFSYGRTWRFCRQHHRLPDHFIDALKQRLQDIIERRGIPWVMAQMLKPKLVGAQNGGH